MKKEFIIGIVILVIVVIGGIFISSLGSKTEETSNDEKVDVASKYEFNYNGNSISINEQMDKEKFGEEVSYYEVPSCAFEGTDKIYEYEHFEVETYEDNGTERIYSIYFTDTKVPTTEGVYVSDSFDKMVEVYGEGYENSGIQYKYTAGNTCLEFIVENNVITSIKYVYVIG